MYLWVDWDDGTQGPYSGPYESGIVNLGHTWYEKGDYTISAKTKDVYSDESEWGTLEVTMPKTDFIVILTQVPTPAFLFGRIEDLHDEGDHINLTAVRLLVIVPSASIFEILTDGFQVAMLKQPKLGFITSNCIVGFFKIW